MKKWWVFGLAVVMIAGVTQADTVTLHADAAPNVSHGESDYDTWWPNAQEAVVAGTFQDMENGVHGGDINPDTGNMWLDPYDEIVWSTDVSPAGGQRLHWVYWLPDQTLDEDGGDLDNGFFETRMRWDWEGTDETYDWDIYDRTTDLEDGWSEPGSWINYDDGEGTTGVIGTFGWAWWAQDDHAEPYDSDDDPSNETDQADIDAYRYIVGNAQTYLVGETRYRASENDDWEVNTIELDMAPVPEPASMALLGLGIAGFAVTRVRKRNAA